MTRLYSFRLPLYCVAGVVAFFVTISSNPEPPERPLWDIIVPSGHLPQRISDRTLAEAGLYVRKSPEWMVNAFSTLADRSSDTLYLVISYFNQYTYGWTTSGKKRLEQIRPSFKGWYSVEHVSKFKYLEAIERWDRNDIKKFEYYIYPTVYSDFFIPEFIYRIIYTNGIIKYDSIFVNVDSIYISKDLGHLIGMPHDGIISY